MLEQGEILTLNDNKQYSVVFSTIINSKNYVYLIDQDDYMNTMFCEFDNNNGLNEVTNPEIVEQIMIKFNETKNQSN